MSSAADTKTVDTIYRDHQGWLRGWLAHRLDCSETAADLAQDTFLRLLGKAEIPNLVEPRAYLRTIAFGLLSNHWRRADIERAYLQVLAKQPELTVPSPEEQYSIIESISRIDSLLAQLPDKVRHAFLLSRLEGVRYADIAETLGVSERMIKKYIARAMLHCLRMDDEA